MADKKDTVDLTPRQTELLIGIVLCAKSKPDVCQYPRLTASFHGQRLTNPRSC